LYANRKLLEPNPDSGERAKTNVTYVAIVSNDVQDKIRKQPLEKPMY